MGDDVARQHEVPQENVRTFGGGAHSDLFVKG